MKPLTTRQKLRASHVKRWHMVDTSRQQTVAEHSFNVRLLVLHMFNMFKSEAWLYGWRDVAAEYALEHDLPEIILGDMPTPSKVTLNDSAKMTNVERGLCPNLIKLDNAPDEVMIIVKVADLIDAVNFLNLHGVGSHANAVRASIVKSANVMMQNLRDDNTLDHHVLGEVTSFMRQAFEWNTDFDNDEDDGYGNF